MNITNALLAAGLSSLVAGFALGDTLYSVGVAADGSGSVYRIDDPFGSPVASQIRQTMPMWDIAISPVTGQAFGIAGSSLYGINLANGSATLIGNQSHDSSQNALEFTPDGTLYSWGFEDTHLYRVDPLTGEADAVMDLKALAGGDLAAVSDTVLYGTTGLALIKIDLVAGTRTLVGGHGGALGNDLLYGLERDSSGDLVGMTGASDQPPRLFRINDQNGVASLIGDVSGAQGLGGFGLAYAVPVPGAFGVLAAWPLIRRRRANGGPVRA